jgi:hypothetical protein
MTILLYLSLGWMTVGRDMPAEDAATNSASPAGLRAVREALRTGEYPWYDPATGKVRPVLERKPAWAKSLGEFVDKIRARIASWLEAVGKFFARIMPERGPGLTASGDFLMTAILWLALAGLLVALWRFWLGRRGWVLARSQEGVLAGGGRLVAELAGSDHELNVDPWNEAKRRRAAGDLAGAVVYLFIHQLVSLETIGLIRLAPGITGRQYVSRLENADLRQALAPNLGLFEDVHYGHRRPSTAAFEAAWRRALAFRRDILGARDDT